MLPITFGSSANEKLEILCLGAHSDDIELGCGGTMLRLLAERPGCVVHWVVFSASGEREQEARASAAELLADAESFTVVTGEFRESYFPFVGADIKDFFEELRHSVRPDLVFTHRRDDDHQDHRMLAQLTWNTFRDHVIAEYEIPKYEGDLGQPNLYVPLPSGVAERKVRHLLRHFGSQRTRAWFRADTFRGLLALRGIECNAQDGLAEGFYVRKMKI